MLLRSVTDFMHKSKVAQVESVNSSKSGSGFHQDLFIQTESVMANANEKLNLCVNRLQSYSWAGLQGRKCGKLALVFKNA